ncbi:MAG: hypothetical protein HQL24_09480 [Candidatus Omnitrophica bacterium]|nr:hypothetical protein [Candidatus Omnitrophota bacterium]
MKLIKAIFFLCALSYVMYAVMFGLFAPQFFQYMNIVPPNHWGYVNFIGATSIIFAIMAFKVAKDPLGKKELIPYVIMYKLFYTIVIFVNKIIYGVPQVWVSMAYLSGIFTAILIACYFYVNCPSHCANKE